MNTGARYTLPVFTAVFTARGHGYCVLFLSLPRSEGWPHHGRTFSIYLYPLSFWLTLPQRVLSTTWCYLSRPCVVFLACVHLALFLALFLSSGNSLVSSWCDHTGSIGRKIIRTSSGDNLWLVTTTATMRNATSVLCDERRNPVRSSFVVLLR